MHDNSLSIHDLVRPSGELTEVTSTFAAEIPSEHTEIIEIARCRISRRPSMMVAFTKCDGQVLTLPYATLSAISSADVTSNFTLRFTRSDIQIRGKNLTRLFHYLCEHRVMELRESSRDVAFSAGTKSIVESILISSCEG